MLERIRLKSSISLLGEFCNAVIGACMNLFAKASAMMDKTITGSSPRLIRRTALSNSISLSRPAVVCKD